MSGLLLLASWCLVGGAVGAAIGMYSGRPVTGLVLGAFCGVFGWVLLAGAPRRERITATPAVSEQIDEVTPPTLVATVPAVHAPLSWRSPRDEQPAIAFAGQL